MSTDLNLSMFRAYDIRTPAADLPVHLAQRLGRAEAAYFRDELGVSGVLLAHDARSTGPLYLEALTDVFTGCGLNVTVIPGVVSTPLFYFAAMLNPGLAGIMVGASHNPAGDTGQKLLAPGVRPIAWDIGPSGGITRLKALYEADASPPKSLMRGRVRFIDPFPQYLEYSARLAGVSQGGLRGVSLLHDYLNGAAGREMSLAFEWAGAILEPLHFAANGAFPLGDPNPVKDSVTKHGRQRLSSGNYVLGTFFDGDGDRIDFYSGNGVYISSSFVYAGILPAIHARRGGSQEGVYADLKCNPLAVMEMARAGFGVKVIRNGHSQIKSALFDDPTMIGCVEESAHFYEAFELNGSRFCTENALYTALLVTREWSQYPQRFERQMELEAQAAREREWGYKFPSDELRAEALQSVQSHFEALGAEAMTHMENGYSLEATMLRKGIPFVIDSQTSLQPGWVQVCQRVSQSEDGLARWEVCADEPAIAAEAKAVIEVIVRQFGAGEEYQG